LDFETVRLFIEFGLDFEMKLSDWAWI